jgi:site-specific DNA-methyltransferase (adenine-specific)
MKTLDEGSVDAIVTDPPYGLSAEPDMAEVLRHWLAGDDYEHRGSGFMGKSWDSFVPGPKVWEEAYRVLKPGGHLVAFFGSRTYDLGAIAIRLAGFHVRDQLQWLYGSGFPKSRNLDGEWNGWGTALKPAHEPIVLARKPLDGTVAENVHTHGTGALNIDGCRVVHCSEEDLATSLSKNPGRASTVTSNTYGKNRPQQSVNTSGRWPANLILNEAAGEMLDGQSGISSGTERRGFPGGSTFGGGKMKADQGQWFGDTGGASRFFYCPKTSKAERNAGVENRAPQRSNYRPNDDSEKNTIRERLHNSRERANHHPTVKPIDLMRWLVRLVTPPNGTVLDPFTGSGSTGCAAILEDCDFIGIEQDPDYADIASARIEWWSTFDSGTSTEAALETGSTESKSRDAGQLAIGDVL